MRRCISWMSFLGLVMMTVLSLPEGILAPVSTKEQCEQLVKDECLRHASMKHPNDPNNPWDDVNYAIETCSSADICVPFLNQGIDIRKVAENYALVNSKILPHGVADFSTFTPASEPKRQARMAYKPRVAGPPPKRPKITDEEKLKQREVQIPRCYSKIREQFKDLVGKNSMEAVNDAAKKSKRMAACRVTGAAGVERYAREYALKISKFEVLSNANLPHLADVEFNLHSGSSSLKLPPIPSDSDIAAMSHHHPPLE